MSTSLEVSKAGIQDKPSGYSRHITGKVLLTQSLKRLIK